MILLIRFGVKLYISSSRGLHFGEKHILMILMINIFDDKYDCIDDRRIV